MTPLLYSAVCAFLLSVSLSAQGPATPVPAAAPVSAIRITARAERESAVYHRSETVTFGVQVARDGKPVDSGEVHWGLFKDGLPLNLQGVAPIQNGTARVSGKLEEPGFLQLRVSFEASPGEKGVMALAGAGIDPDQIRPSLPAPEDFDAFWEAQKAELARVPVEARLTRVEYPSTQVETFDLQAPALGAPVSGYFARPAGAKPRSLPILLSVHGAGVRGSLLGGVAGAAGWAAKGFLAMDMNAHGLPNGQPADFYKAQAAGPLKGYPFLGREDRNRCYFRGMFLRLVRALDVLTAQPEWDGKTVIVLGNSQGGYQAIAAAGIDPRVSFLAAGVAAGCDHSAMKANRIAGWPKIVPLDADHNPDPKVLETARYFDAVNFASRAKAAGAFLTTSFIDAACPPTTVYAAYNALQIPKQIVHDVPLAHSVSAESTAFMNEAILRHVAEQKKR